jgi:outer membrane protein assembly factor BamB
LTAPVAMAGSSTAIGRGRFTPGRAGGNRSGEFYAVSSDGYLHVLNTSTGADRMPPMKFLPANAKVSGLNVDNNVVYAATLDQCGGNANALYAIDLSAASATVASFPAHGGGFAGVAGSAIGADGTVYTAVGDPASDTVFALAAKTLEVKDHFAAAGKPDVDSPGVTPVVFPWKGRDVIVAGGRDGHVYLLDSKSLGGADHHTPLAQTSYATNGGFRGAFSTWEDADGGTRRVYASSGNFVAGMKVEEVSGQPALTQVWKSKDMIAPAPVVTANGLVFVLATGDARRANNRAILYALDAATGAELYSSGPATATWAHNSGIAIANNRIYFTTHDNLVYCFGFFAQQPQLTGK